MDAVNLLKNTSLNGYDKSVDEMKTSSENLQKRIDEGFENPVRTKSFKTEDLMSFTDENKKDDTKEKVPESSLFDDPYNPVLLKLRKKSKNGFKSPKKDPIETLSVSSSSGCNTSTPSCEHDENNNKNQHTEIKTIRKYKAKLREFSSNASVNSSDVSNRCGELIEISEEESTSVEDLVANNYDSNLKTFLNEYKNSKVKAKFDETNEDFSELSSSEDEEEKSDKKLKSKNKNDFLSNIEATEVEIEYIVYPDDCCPVCFSEKCMCCCKHGFRRFMSWFDASKLGRVFWKSRMLCFHLVEHKWFETVIIAMIIFSSLSLVSEIIL